MLPDIFHINTASDHRKQKKLSLQLLDMFNTAYTGYVPCDRLGQMTGMKYEAMNNLNRVAKSHFHRIS